MKYKIPIIMYVDSEYCGNIFTGTFDVVLTDVDIKRLEDWVEANPDGVVYDCMPSDIFDKILDAQGVKYDWVIEEIRKEGYGSEPDHDEPFSSIQGCIPAGILQFMPEELYDRLEIDEVLDLYDVDSLEELFALDEYKAVPLPDDE